MLGGRGASERLAGRIDSDLPSISVIVQFRRNECCILDCLQSIMAMDYPGDKLEVIVVDDSSDDLLADCIRSRFPNVRLIRNRHSLGCDGAKQAGIDASTCDAIAFTDADCLLPASWARGIAENLLDGADVVTGPVRHPKTFLRELIAVADFRDAQSDCCKRTDAFPGCNFALWRRHMDGIPYNRSGAILGGSDRLLSWSLHRTGRVIAYDPRVSVSHFPSVTPLSLFARRIMYGRTAFAMRKLDPTLPGSFLTRLGILAGPTYVCFKTAKDLLRLGQMAAAGNVNPWHAAPLMPLLFLFRLVDAVGIATAPYLLKTTPIPARMPQHEQQEPVHTSPR